MPSRPEDPADAIAAALARLRGRKMPRPPWADGPPPHGGWGHGSGHGGPHGAGGRGGPHGGGPTHGDGHGAPGWGRGHGAPPWAGAARIGGPARMRLLEALAAASHPLSVGEIADAVGVDQPRASRL